MSPTAALCTPIFHLPHLSAAMTLPCMAPSVRTPPMSSSRARIRNTPHSGMSSSRFLMRAMSAPSTRILSAMGSATLPKGLMVLVRRAT